MGLGNKTFWFFTFFLVGVGAASVGVSLSWVVLLAALFCVLVLFVGVQQHRKSAYALGVLVWMMCAGAFYYTSYEARYAQSYFLSYDRDQSILGRVVSHPRRTAASQEIILRTSEGEKIFIRLNPYSFLTYGDSVEFFGSIQRLDDQTRYLKTQGVIGTMLFPNLVERQASSGFSLAGSLYGLRDFLSGKLFSLFPSSQASLMSGLLFGQESAEFSASFKEAMKQSGTTHLVALSGYNISILIAAVATLASFLAGRRGVFVISVIVIILFVAMTGAQSSVVRAAIMGVLIIASRMFSRIYHFRNSIAAAAFVMVLWNPMVLYFDVGFVLSFFALLGIVYGASACSVFVKQKGLLGSLAHIALETTWAQVAVLPVLVLTFGLISTCGVLANIILLPLIPFTMLAGGIVLGVTTLIPLAGKILSLGLWAILSFETWIIHLFGSFPSLEIHASVLFLAFYYLVLSFIIYQIHRYARTYAYRA